MILVDTNVLLRAVQPAHPHCDTARSAVKMARTREYVPCIVPQIIYEFWVVATRPFGQNGLGLTAIEAEVDVTQIIEQFHLFRDERTILGRWQQLVVRHDVLGKTAHDARLVAAMNRHAITHLLTFNTADFQRFAGITVVHPENVLNLSAK